MTPSSYESENPDVLDQEPPLLTANVLTVSPYDPDDLVTDPRTKLRGLVPGLVSLAIGIAIVLLTEQVREVGNLPLGPRFWPGMVGWGIIVFGVILLVTFFLRGIKYADVPDEITGWGIGRFFMSAIVAIGYLLTWGLVPFWIPTLVVFVVLLWIYGARGWKALLLFPVIVTAVLHFLFVVALRVPL